MTIASKPSWCAMIWLWCAASLAAAAPAGPAPQTAPATQSGPASAPAPERGADPIALANRLAAALGGWSAYDELRYLRFAFVIERDGRELVAREHLWDKHRDRTRVEWSDQEGHAYVAVLDLSSKNGRALRDGTELAGAELGKALEQAYGAWVNDTYWLVMPFKTRDPGVHLAAEGREEIEGRTYAKLGLSFEKVGLTPGDRYWVYIDEDSGQMERWAYVLEGKQPPPVVWRWRDWQPVGGVELSTEKVRDNGTIIRMRGLGAPSSVPRDVLIDPHIPLPRN